MSTTLTLLNCTNGSSVTKTTITDGDTYSWRIDDALDSGVIMYTDSSLTPIEPFTLATINFDDGSTEKMWVAEDSVVMLSKINNSKVYQHTLKLVELTKILEKILVTGICMTPVEKDEDTPMYDSLLDQFDMALTKIGKQSYFITLARSTGFDTATMSQQEPETFVFNNSTAREILDEICSAVDSRVVVSNASYSGGTGGDVNLSIDYIKMVAGSDVTLGSNTHHKLISESSSNSVEGYAGEIYSNVESAVSDNEITIQDTMKANDALATSSNRIMSLPYAIQYPTAFKIKSTTAKISVKGTYYVAGDSSAHTITNDVTDVSGASTRDFFEALDYFVDYEYWATLSLNNQNKTLYYRRGEAEVDVSRTYKSLLVTKNVFQTMFTELLNAWYTDNYQAIWDYMSAQATAAGGTLTSITKNSVTPGDIDDIIYEISYIGEIDGLATSSKAEDREAFERDLKIVDGQRANVLDITRYGRNLEGKIARVGNDITYIDCDVDSYANILPLLTRLTDYGNGIIYQADISRHTDSETWYEVRYYLSKNYNDLNERIALKKEKRIYAIPTKGYQVIIPTRETVYIAKGVNQDHYGVATSLSETPGIIAKAIGGDAHAITNAFVGVTPGSAAFNYFTLPATAYGSGNAINFIAKFYDNASAGLSIDTNNYGGINWLGGKKVCYNKYTNNYGYANYLLVRWGYYPNARTTEGVKAQPKRPIGNEPGAETVTTVFQDEMDYDKDPSEALCFQRIIKVLPYDNKVIVGCFCDLNCLIKNVGDVYLYYQNTDRDSYKPGDRKVRYNSGTDTKVNLSGLLTYTLDTTYNDRITVSASSLGNIGKYNIALGDNDGNMYVAFNGYIFGADLFHVFRKEAKG